MTSVVAAVVFVIGGTVAVFIAFDSCRDLIDKLMTPERDWVGIVLDAILWFGAAMMAALSVVCLAAVL